MIRDIDYAYWDKGKGKGVHTVVIEFDDEQEAKDFASTMSGVLRTLQRKRKKNK